MGQEPKARSLDREPRVVGLHQGQRTQSAPTGRTYDEGRQRFTAEIKTLAKGPSTYDPLENAIRRLQPAGMRKNRSFRERHSERSSRTAA